MSKVTGVEAMLTTLDKISTTVVPKVQESIKTHGGQLQREAQRYAPVAKVAGGTLKRSIELEIKDGGFTAEVSPYADYAVYQEYGTRYQSGTPYMRPAFHKVKLAFMADITRMMK